MQPLLSGVRLLDLTRMLAGPYGSQLLGDLGAEVIKVEPPGGDPIRQMGPHFTGGQSAYFLSCNRNKRSICLNLKLEKGRQLFLELVARSDVVYENFRPGVMERLGLSYDTLRDAKPDIILCSVSGYGRQGPRRDQPAFDLALQAVGGAMSVTGARDGKPVRMGLPMADLAGGMFAALAIVSALHRRSQTGEGSHLDISLMDGQVSLLSYMAQYYLVSGEVARPWGSEHESVVPYNAYATADGHLVIAVFTDKFWTACCRTMELDSLLTDPRFATAAARRQHRDALNALLAERFQTETTAVWIERFREAQVPANPIQNIAEVMADPQVLARNMRVAVEHPTVGRLEMVGSPIRAIGRAMPLTPPPLSGEHTREILIDLLGLSSAEVEALQQEAVIETGCPGTVAG